MSNKALNKAIRNLRVNLQGLILVGALMLILAGPVNSRVGLHDGELAMSFGSIVILYGFNLFIYFRRLRRVLKEVEWESGQNGEGGKQGGDR